MIASLVPKCQFSHRVQEMEDCERILPSGQDSNPWPSALGNLALYLHLVVLIEYIYSSLQWSFKVITLTVYHYYVLWYFFISLRAEIMSCIITLDQGHFCGKHLQWQGAIFHSSAWWKWIVMVLPVLHSSLSEQSNTDVTVLTFSWN